MPVTHIVVYLRGPKTGTGAIQRALRENPGPLADERIVYPRSKYSRRKAGGGNAQPLASYLYDYRDSAPFDELLRTLDGADADTLILSSEFLFRTPGDALRTLTDTLCNRNLELLGVVYLRHQADMVTSVYSQRVRRGEVSQSLAAFAA